MVYRPAATKSCMRLIVGKPQHCKSMGGKIRMCCWPTQAFSLSNIRRTIPGELLPHGGDQRPTLNQAMETPTTLVETNTHGASPWSALKFRRILYQTILPR